MQHTKEKLKTKLRELKAEMEQDPVWKVWRKQYGVKASLTSRDQLSNVLHVQLEYEVNTLTDSGKPSTDEEALQKIDNPFVAKLLRYLKYEKALGTFLKGIEKEIAPDGRLHPVFNLHIVVSYRSCVAKGTFIEAMRDVSKHPRGIPIESIKKGDFVYCYDSHLNLTLRKVLWAGKTGHREVIRVHWGARGKKGWTDLTPEHRVRLSDGRYVQARHLVGDFRTENDSRNSSKIRLLAMGRELKKGLLYQTGKAKGIHEARLIYERMVGPLLDSDVVHHKDNNHFNNSTVKNLEKKTKSSHSKDHMLAGDYFTKEDRQLGSRLGNKTRKLKGYENQTGKKHVNWLKITKYQFLRMMAKCGGKIVKLSHDFETMKKKAVILGIDVPSIKDRYDADGFYISFGRLKRNFDGSLESVHNAFRINHAKAQRVLKQRGLFGERINNHRVVRIEHLKRKTDVYDIEVEGCHNFIANEICVHNSSDSPNFQNYPVRDKEISKIIRSCFIASPESVLVENDFKGIEVAISAAYHHDENFISYITTPGKDMHRDMAAQIYKLDPKEVTKDTRYGSKNMFVFPQFYGDYYIACAKNMWEWIGRGKLKTVSGIPLYEHLKEQGITGLGKLDPEQKPRPGTFEHHLKEVEDDFWNNRFRAYGQWRRDWYNSYLKKGYFDLLTGFRIEGCFNRKQVCNFPIQGAAFHCLLWSLIRIQKILNKRGMKSKIVGQIHDSLIGDVRIDELQEYLSIVEQVTTVDLREHYEWLVVPPEIEYEIAPEDSSWFDKAEIKFKNGRFIHPEQPEKTTTDANKFLKIISK